MSEAKRKLANIDVFEQEPGARPADLIGGLGRSREPRIRSSVSLSELFDDRRLPRDLADDLRAVKEAAEAGHDEADSRI